jgi:hypothetical protein
MQANRISAYRVAVNDADGKQICHTKKALLPSEVHAKLLLAQRVYPNNTVLIYRLDVDGTEQLVHTVEPGANLKLKWL